MRESIGAEPARVIVRQRASVARPARRCSNCQSPDRRGGQEIGSSSVPGRTPIRLLQLGVPDPRIVGAGAARRHAERRVAGEVLVGGGRSANVHQRARDEPAADEVLVDDHLGCGRHAWRCVGDGVEERERKRGQEGEQKEKEGEREGEGERSSHVTRPTAAPTRVARTGKKQAACLCRPPGRRPASRLRLACSRRCVRPPTRRQM